MMRAPYVTPAPWKPLLQRPQYATDDTYRLAAEWLKGCATVADWGGGSGYFRDFLPATVGYRNVDGTAQTSEQVLADLVHYREPSDGILLRHVIEINVDWRTILRNALEACRHRLVVVTFTPPAEETTLVHIKSGWAVHRFDVRDLLTVMSPYLVGYECVRTTHPERVFYLERR